MAEPTKGGKTLFITTLSITTFSITSNDIQYSDVQHERVTAFSSAMTQHNYT
jgi:hypothetical protein